MITTGISTVLVASDTVGTSPLSRTSKPMREWPLRPLMSMKSVSGRDCREALAHRSRTSPRNASLVLEKRVRPWASGAASSSL